MSTGQFGRIVEFSCGSVNLTSDELRIEFRVEFDDDPTPNTSEVTIYNLSESTRNSLKKGAKVTMNAGYKGDKGVILSGFITKVVTHRSGTDHPTIITVIDSQPIDEKKSVKTAYKNNVKSSHVLSDLANRINTRIAALNLPNDKTFVKGYSVSGSAVEAMKKVSQDAGASMYINRGQLYIRSIKEGDDAQFKLNADTGLIGSPEPFEEETDDKKGVSGYKVKSLLQYRMNTASIIQLESRVVSGRFRVRKGTHSWSGDGFYTEVEVL